MGAEKKKCNVHVVARMLFFLLWTSRVLKLAFVPDEVVLCPIELVRYPPVTLKLFYTVVKQLARHASRIQWYTSTRDALFSRPVGVFWWMVVAIYSVYT